MRLTLDEHVAEELIIDPQAIIVATAALIAIVDVSEVVTLARGLKVEAERFVGHDGAAIIAPVELGRVTVAFGPLEGGHVVGV